MFFLKKVAGYQLHFYLSHQSVVVVLWCIYVCVIFGLVFPVVILCNNDMFYFM